MGLDLESERRGKPEEDPHGLVAPGPLEREKPSNRHQETDVERKMIDQRDNPEALHQTRCSTVLAQPRAAARRMPSPCAGTRSSCTVYFTVT
ncbi:hypothetical protein [Streptomyces sp. NPDC004528]|uniref:hypothetical protein n=1 Tax=Streptomyces sp. NPDC004528 TaxID=3154550 RepID=UPI0033BEE8DE